MIVGNDKREIVKMMGAKDYLSFKSRNIISRKIKFQEI